MSQLNRDLDAKLKERKLAGNLRQLNIYTGSTDFFSNDYLGLATHGVFKNFAADSATGSTGSRLISGNSKAFETLEARIAAFHGAEAALIFNSGYDANLGLLSSIADRHTTILYDELCHASIIDGVRLSLCSSKHKFRHNDINHLEELLARLAGKSVIVVAESVYSMDGDIAPLVDMANLCERYAAELIVDEAHATGVFGKHGEGLVVALGLQDAVFARVHTFGKALGCHGAVVVGSKTMRDYLINFARSFIYTTALPSHSIACVAEAYNHLADAGFTNQPLHDLISYFRQQVTQRGLTGWVDSTSSIQALIVGDSTKCQSMAHSLRNNGLMVKAILHPTVPQGSERLRVCLHTFNTKGQVARLLDFLQ